MTDLKPPQGPHLDIPPGRPRQQGRHPQQSGPPLVRRKLPARPSTPGRAPKWPLVVGGIAVLISIGIASGGNGDAEPAAATAPTSVSAVGAPHSIAVPPQVVPEPVVPEPITVFPPVTSEPVAPALPVSRQNAVDAAENYLSFSSFSRQGLIDQLEFEQYSTDDATFAVDRVTVDWDEQAAKSAQNYMEFSSFSRGSLIDQLEFEAFTPAQAEHGADSVGL